MPTAAETYITTEVISSFRTHLISEEKSEFTIDKYIRDVTAFAALHKMRLIRERLSRILWSAANSQIRA